MTEPASPDEPAMPDPPPAEPAAVTPSPQPPVLWPVVRTLLSLLRRHGLRVYLFAVVIALSTAAIAIVLAMAQYGCVYSGIADKLPMYYIVMALWTVVTAVLGPLVGGYYLAVHQLLVGEKAGVRTLAAGYRSGRLFSRLAIVSGVLAASSLALYDLWSWLPWNFCWEYFSNIVTPGSPLDEMLGSIPQLGWLIGEFHFAVRTLIYLPILWALLEVIVACKSWPAALAGSARLAWRHKRLALVMLAVLVALSFESWVHALLPRQRDYLEGYTAFAYSLAGWLILGGNALITCAVTAMKAAALVVVYREMRKNDGAVPPPEIA